MSSKNCWNTLMTN